MDPTRTLPLILLATVGLALACGGLVRHPEAAAPDVPNPEAAAPDVPVTVTEEPLPTGEDWANAIPDASDELQRVPHHCGPSEQVIMTCELVDKPDKVLSVCASEPITGTAGVAKYRFGRIGQVELEFPASDVHPSKVFAYQFEPEGAFSGTATLQFVNEGHLFEIEHAWNQGDESVSLRIVPPRGEPILLACGWTENELGRLGTLLPPELPPEECCCLVVGPSQAIDDGEGGTIRVNEMTTTTATWASCLGDCEDGPCPEGG